MAEAYALRDGISLAQHLGFQNFIIQSDNMQVIDTMLSGGISSTSSAAILEDYRMLSLGMRKITFQHCHRETNKVADELARHSYLNHVDCFWDDEPPIFLFPKLINDVGLFNCQ
jgi:hypothetical protein